MKIAVISEWKVLQTKDKLSSSKHYRILEVSLNSMPQALSFFSHEQKGLTMLTSKFMLSLQLTAIRNNLDIVIPLISWLRCLPVLK
jgi:hypothetical protein